VLRIKKSDEEAAEQSLWERRIAELLQPEKRPMTMWWWPPPSSDPFVAESMFWFHPSVCIGLEQTLTKWLGLSVYLVEGQGE